MRVKGVVRAELHKAADVVSSLAAKLTDAHVPAPSALPGWSRGRVLVGTGGRSIVISGMVTDIAAWLAGREPTLGSLRASAAADNVDVPELLPWPAGVPTP